MRLPSYFLLHPLPLLLLWTFAFTLSFPACAELELPEGFTLTEVAGPELADNIYAMTLDRAGRPVVSGPRYIRRLHDDDGDGQYDRASELPHAPRSGAMGLLFDDDGSLIYWGDNAIHRMNPATPDTPPTVLWNAGGGEHGMHAFIRGPDNWIYGVGGNRAGLKNLPYTDGTLIEKPHAGSIFRFSPDGKQLECVAQGYRNSYDIAFDSDDHLYTFDSDSERWHHLPHYTPMRLFQVALGGHHGWMYERTDRAWKRPNHFHDSVPSISDLGRGSPTGLVCYDHRQFPERYRGSLFGLCWSSGRVFHFPLEKSGTKTVCNAEPFLTATAGSSFPAVDIDVSREGDLLVAVGGRGTRGAIYRIRHGDPVEPKTRGAEIDQPLSAWSRSARGITSANQTTTKAPLPKTVRPQNPFAELDRADSLARLKSKPPALPLIRHLQILLGDVHTQVKELDRIGYVVLPSKEKKNEETTTLDLSGVSFPTSSPLVDWELGRLFAMAHCDDAKLLNGVLEKITSDTDPADDIHWLLCAGQMHAERSPQATRKTAAAFGNLHRKMTERGYPFTRYWPRYVSASFATHCERDPELAKALLADTAFGHSGHVLFLDQLPAEALGVLAGSKWTPELVSKLGALDDAELLPALRKNLADPKNAADITLLGHIAVLLGKRGLDTDLSLIANVLDHPSANTSERLARVLQRFPSSDPAVFQAIKAHARHRTNDRARRELEALLKQWTGEDSAWDQWYLARHPDDSEAAADLAGFAATTDIDWPERLGKVDWSAGDVVRGKLVYQQRACASCHDANSRLGPALNGVSKRFDRDALFASIVNPHATISPAYKAIEVTTREGETYVGSAVYDSPAHTILAIAPNVTVMVKDIVKRGPATRSIMPEGLLNDATPEQLADLYAFLSSR